MRTYARSLLLLLLLLLLDRALPNQFIFPRFIFLFQKINMFSFVLAPGENHLKFGFAHMLILQLRFALHTNFRFICKTIAHLIEIVHGFFSLSNFDFVERFGCLRNIINVLKLEFYYPTFFGALAYIARHR